MMHGAAAACAARKLERGFASPLRLEKRHILCECNAKLTLLAPLEVHFAKAEGICRF
jgi:hypothetical protein